ncbi:MAG: DegT/DnrJ/EryC1/StrS family aminotransferase [Kiritimatiellia bacterium]|jgi:8-amino-3,8-dideoxy-alpha-D-manno-octulosonate transaminase|nr:DegT/DnrJ/EryC1/StrS family aminotransferase [Kiritimatiellia bacterium]
MENDKLAINGGAPVRSRPLPQEWCGAHYMDELESEAAARVCASKTLFRYYGLDLQNEVAQLENEFAAYIGVRYALAVSSGTGALQVALGALGVGPGDEVLVPGYFWVSTVGAVVRAGAIPVLVDCDATFSMDPQDAARKITPRTRVILIVHMGGVIGRVTEIVALARRHNLKVVEDCAQAAGASQKGVKAGAFGDMAIFSFQMNKHMTSGEGGMVVTNSENLYHRAFAIHDLGYPRNDAGRLVMDDPSLQLWGIGCRMSELTASVARVQLTKLDRITCAMRSAKLTIKRALAGVLTFREVPDPDGDAGSFLMTVFPSREQSLKFTAALRAEGVVAGKGGMYPIHMDDWGLHIYYNVASLVNKRGISGVSPWQMAENRASADVSYAKGTCPHLDDRISRTMIFCVASNLTDADVRDIIAAYQKVAAAVCV